MTHTHTHTRWLSPVLHLRGPGPAFTVQIIRLGLATPCPCGLPAPRLRDLLWVGSKRSTWRPGRKLGSFRLPGFSMECLVSLSLRPPLMAART